MTRFIAFLRAINVGGHTVKMDALRTLFESMRLATVETFIASGNVIFETNAKSLDALHTKIERKLLDAFGYEVAAFLRTDSEVAAIAQYKPFKASEMASAVAFNVGFLAEPLGSAARKTLMTFKTDIDDFHTHDREVYWLCKKKQSDSTFSGAVFERALGVRVTFRGINTIQRLTAKYPPA